MPIRTAGARGDLKSFQVTKGIEYAADNGADVINMSFGNMTGNLVKSVMRYAAAQGVVLVASSGNESEHTIVNRIPAGFKDVITVGASTHLDTRASYSNYGFGLDVVAPGGEQTDILSPKAAYYCDTNSPNIVGDFYLRARGTSFSAPYVTGLAGLLLSKEPDLSVEEIRQRLRMTAVDIEKPGWDLETGWGRIDAYGALNSGNRCIARIDSPINGDTLDYKSRPKILGSVGGSSFKRYTLELNFDGNNKLIQDGTIAVEKNVFTNVDLSGRIGRFIVRLRAYDASGTKCAEDIISFASGFKFSHAVLPLPINLVHPTMGIGEMEFVRDRNGSPVDNLLLNWRSLTYEDKNGVIAGFPNLRDNMMALPFTELLLPSNDSGIASNVGDINTDGRDDIAITDKYDRVLIRWGGNAGYTSIEGFPDSPTSSVLFSPTSGDIDGDGKTDLIIMHSTRKLYIFLGKNFQRWSQPHISSSSADIIMDLPFEYDTYNQASIQSGHDVNGDRCHDILVNRQPTTSDTSTSYLIFGGTNFASNVQMTAFHATPLHVNYHPSENCYGHFVNDINGDGLGDIAFNCTPPFVAPIGALFDRPAVQVFLGRKRFPLSFDILNDADAQWQTEENRPTEASTGISSLGDMNGDGLADFFLLTEKHLYLLVGSDKADKWHKSDLLYNADQIIDLSFEGRASLAGDSSPYNQNAGDIDGNGINDLLLTERTGNNIHILFVDNKPQTVLRPEMDTGVSSYIFFSKAGVRIYNDGSTKAKISGFSVVNEGRARLRVQSESCAGAEILLRSYCSITLRDGSSSLQRLLNRHPATLVIKANDKNADVYGNLKFPIGW
ncbi:MAG: S8 family serine peptidase [Deltaproteobacteria bacterium]|nr:S8 family serine peptidase [Deltaproteobacteria bacterium]